MNRAPNHYQLLNVSRTATADQIRSAYLAVMKRHHPDVAEGRSDASDFLPLINHVYKSLSDPVTRAAYDAELAWQERAHRSGRGSDLPPYGRRRGDRALNPLSVRAAAGGRGAVLLVGALIFLGGAIALAPGAERPLQPAQAFQSAPTWLQPLAPPRANLSAWRLPSRSAISRYAHIGANLAEEQAAVLSQGCFARARELPTRDAAQLCVVLDDAFLYTHGTRPLSLSPYFNNVMVDLRHASALDVAPDDPQLRHLWQASFAALMTELHGTSLERSSAADLDRSPQPPSNTGNVAQTGAPRPLPHSGTGSAAQR